MAFPTILILILIIHVLAFFEINLFFLVSSQLYLKYKSPPYLAEFIGWKRVELDL